VLARELHLGREARVLRDHGQGDELVLLLDGTCVVAVVACRLRAGRVASLALDGRLSGRYPHLQAGAAMQRTKLAVLISALLVAAHACGGTVDNTDVLPGAEDGGHELDARQESDERDAFEAGSEADTAQQPDAPNPADAVDIDVLSDADAANDHDSLANADATTDADTMTESGDEIDPDAASDASTQPDAWTEAGDAPEETEAASVGDVTDVEPDAADADDDFEDAPATCFYPSAECDGDPTSVCETALNTLTDCGGCGQPCSADHGSATCATGSCSVQACDSGWGDCNGLATDGCEADLSASAGNCGTCGNACNSNGTGAGFCSQGACICVCYPGWGNCDADPTICCEMELNTTSNCGACGISCANEHGGTSCTAGACVPVCSAGYASCDGNPNNGCETDLMQNLANCGSCGHACDCPDGGANCIAGTCGCVSCVGWGNCDGIVENGCETPLNTLKDCGACGVPCALAHSTATCFTGSCQIKTCDSGFASCDGLTKNGCEVNLNSDPNHCGSCGTVCPGPVPPATCPFQKKCVNGMCAASSCMLPYADCDGNSANGCETNLLNSVENCGVCGLACAPPHATGACAACVCAIAQCDAGWADCDGLYDNGCETNLAINAANCGGCGNNCNAGQVCHDGACGCAPEACVPATCQGHTYACSDCVDNDGDGLTDAQDPGCTGACDNTEESYAPMIPGVDFAPCFTDCFFDLNAGSGNDECRWDHRCDPLEVAPQPDPEDKCPYNPSTTVGGETCAQLSQSQSPTCSAYCGPLVPNGCDCFGCCELPAGSATWVWLGSYDVASNLMTCTPDTVSDQEKCRPCTPVPSCTNPCEHCELCIGKQTLPSDCAVQQCAAGHQPCGLPCQPGCAPGSYCVAGCCQANAI
jgi:hypothetical protein